MTLIKCYACFIQISDKAESCPHCGAHKLKKCFECNRKISQNIDCCPHCGAKETAYNVLDTFLQKNKVFYHLWNLFTFYIVFNFFIHWIFYSYYGPIKIDEDISFKELLIYCIYFLKSSMWIKIAIVSLSYFTYFIDNEQKIDNWEFNFNSLYKSIHSYLLIISVLMFMYTLSIEQFNLINILKEFSVNKINDNFLIYMFFHPIFWIMFICSLILSFISYIIKQIINLK